MIARVARTAQRLTRDRRGVSFLEFGLFAPVFCGMTIAGIELGNVALANLKVQRLSNMVASMVSQRSGSPTGLNEMQVNDLFLAMNQTSKPFDIGTRGRIIITAALGTDSNSDEVADKNTIMWQRMKGALVEAPMILGCWKTTTEARLPGNRQLTLHEPIYHAQVSYRYEPLIGGTLFGMMPIPDVITKVTMFRSRGPFFKPILTVIGQPVRTTCTSAEGT